MSEKSFALKLFQIVKSYTIYVDVKVGKLWN
jgi:hypothetical protein